MLKLERRERIFSNLVGTLNRNSEWSFLATFIDLVNKAARFHVQPVIFNNPSSSLSENIVEAPSWRLFKRLEAASTLSYGFAIRQAPRAFWNSMAKINLYDLYHK